MLKLARWSTTHRKYVLLGWVVLLLGVNLLAHSAGTKYSNNFTLPHSDAQRASDLLKRSFPAQAGDRDTIVFAVRSGTVLDPAVRARVGATLGTVAKLPHVASVISPYGGTPAGTSISADRRIAFATVVSRTKPTRCPRQPPNAWLQSPAAPRGRVCKSSSAGRRLRRPSGPASACPPPWACWRRSSCC